jgi:hypothetical protein
MPSSGLITAKSRLNRKSWGEHIRIQLSPVSDHETRIAIQSDPAFAPTLVDYGQNQTNVSQIISGLRLSLPSSL